MLVLVSLIDYDHSKTTSLQPIISQQKKNTFCIKQ